jgi:hypothetical protein
MAPAPQRFLQQQLACVNPLDPRARKQRTQITFTRLNPPLHRQFALN